MLEFLNILVLYMRHHLVQRNSAVADCRIEIVNAVESLTLRNFKQKFFKLTVVEPYEVALEFTLNLHLALKNIFFSALFFEPRTDFVPCAAGLDKFKPVTARTLVLLRGGDDFYNFSRFYDIIYRNDSSVNLCADHSVADRRVNRIGKVNDGCACRKIDNRSLGSEHENLLLNKVGLYCVYDILRIFRNILAFEKLTNP